MSRQPRIAVILSGCGVYDGAEIHESVLTLLALSREGAAHQCLAPDVAQRRVVDHVTGQATGETRNVLVESARIARGAIQSLEGAKPTDFDGAILPGGYGAALNLSSYGVAGADMTVEPTTSAFLVAMVKARKPIAAVCIAPPILARVLREAGVTTSPHLTVGEAGGDDGKNLTALGATPVQCTAKEVVVDRESRVITSPAYMLATSLSELEVGITRTVRELLALVG